MRDTAFFSAIRFYVQVLAGVLAVIGFFSIIGLYAGWLVQTEPSRATSPSDTLAIDSDEPVLALGRTLLMSQMIPVDPGLTYDLSAEVRSSAPTEMKRAAAITYLGVATYDRNGTELRSGPGSYRYAGAEKYLLYGNPEWRTLAGSITGEGDETHNQFRPGTRFVRIVALLNYEAAGTQTESGMMSSEIRNVQFEPRVHMKLD